MAAGQPSSLPTEPDPRLPVWLRPVPVLASILVFTIVVAWLTSVDEYRIEYRSPKWVNGHTVLWVLYLTAGLCIPAMIVAAERLRSQPRRSWTFSPAEHRALRRVLTGLFALTMLGYLIWLAKAAGNGFHFGQVSTLLKGTTDESATIKEQFTTVSGVTTMTQFGIPLSVIGALVWPQTTRAVRAMTTIVVVLGGLRALVASERLAIFEVVVPVVVVVAARYYNAAGTGPKAVRKRFLIRAIPFVAIPVLILSFAGFEYTRSWSWWRHHTQESFLVFETKRLSGYYSTSYNNAQMMQTTHSWPPPGALPYFTLYGLWNFPVFRDVVHYEDLSGGANFFSVYRPALNRYANEEFNNFGGITDATYDYGTVGGVVFVGLCGALFGAAYAAFSQRRRWGLLFYPIFFIAFLDIPREWYIANGRALPAFAGALFAAAVLRRVRHRERRRAAQGARRTLRSPRGAKAATQPAGG